MSTEKIRSRSKFYPTSKTYDLLYPEFKQETTRTSPPEPSIIPKFLDYFADFPYSRYSNTPELPKRGYLMRLLVRFNSDTKVTRIFMELRFHNDFWKIGEQKIILLFVFVEEFLFIINNFIPLFLNRGSKNVKTLIHRESCQSR